MRIAGLRTESEGAHFDDPVALLAMITIDIMATATGLGVYPRGALEVGVMESLWTGERCYRWHLDLDEPPDQAVR